MMYLAAIMIAVTIATSLSLANGLLQNIKCAMGVRNDIFSVCTCYIESKCDLPFDYQPNVGRRHVKGAAGENARNVPSYVHTMLPGKTNENFRSITRCKEWILRHNCNIGNNEIDYINISDNQQKINEIVNFNDYQNAFNIDISNNSIESLSATIFHNISRLRFLNLHTNQLTSLESELFKFNTKLVYLNLSNNSLSIFPETLFHNLRKLEYLDLSDNKVSNNSDDLFLHLNQLKVLYLERCNLDTVPQFVVKHNLTKLQYLTLTQNFITSLEGDIFKNLAGLVILDFTANEISYLHKSVFKTLTNLQEINLTFNNLYYLPPTLLNDLPNLNKLNISYNIIEVIPDNLFEGSSKINSLSLIGNNLTFLPKNLTRDIPDLKVIQLGHNPWQCDCIIDIVNTWTEASFEYTSIFSDGMKHMYCEFTVMGPRNGSETTWSEVGNVCVSSIADGCERNVDQNWVYQNIYMMYGPN